MAVYNKFMESFFYSSCVACGLAKSNIHKIKR